jgi:hypothetical protein
MNDFVAVIVLMLLFLSSRGEEAYQSAPLHRPESGMAITPRSGHGRVPFVVRWTGKSSNLPVRVGVRHRILCEGIAHRLAPAFVAPGDGVASGGIGHSEEPPALFWSQAEPVFNGRGNQARIGVLYSPGEQDQLLAEEA